MWHHFAVSICLYAFKHIYMHNSSQKSYNEPFPFSFEKTLAKRIAPKAKEAKLRRTRRGYGALSL